MAAGEEKEKLAVENAREEWREAVVMETRQSVEKAIFSTRQQWQSRYYLMIGVGYDSLWQVGGREGNGEERGGERKGKSC